MDELFIEIYQKYFNDVYRLIYSRTLNVQDSEDIAQKTFTKLYKSISKFSVADENVKKWLFKAAVNNTNDFFKAIWYTKKVYLENLENIALDVNMEKNVISYLNDIPPNYRIPLYLYYYEGYSIKEISEIMKLTESCVKIRLKRSKEKLKLEMENS